MSWNSPGARDQLFQRFSRRRRHDKPPDSQKIAICRKNRLNSLHSGNGATGLRLSGQQRKLSIDMVSGFPELWCVFS